MHRILFIPVRSLAVVALLLLLAGCMGGGSAPIRYYLVDPVPVEPLQAEAGDVLAVEILDLHLPQYLERFNIATRTGENRLAFSDQHQWGENLRKNLMRTLARNLSRYLDTVDVSTPLNRSSSRPDVRVQVYIEQFERDAGGRVRLVSRWQLSDGASNEALLTRRAELAGESVVAAGDYEAMVADMRELFGELSRRITGSILAQVETGD